MLRRGEIGVNAQTITPVLAAGLNLARQSGVILADVYPDWPANVAGLEIGDVILSLGDKPMENGRQFLVNLYGKAEGANGQRCCIAWKGHTETAVEIIERQAYQEMLTTMVTPDRNLVPQLGILGIDLNPQLQNMLGETRYPNGIVVAARSKSGQMWEQSLQPGDIIYSVNGSKVESLEQLRSTVSSIKLGAVVLTLNVGSSSNRRKRAKHDENHIPWCRRHRHRIEVSG